jgi:hypothetical protein
MLFDTLLKEKELSKAGKVRRIWDISQAEKSTATTSLYLIWRKEDIQIIKNWLDIWEREITKKYVSLDISLIIQKHIKLFWHPLRQREKSEKLKQQALFLIVEKFSKIKKVKSIYVQRYREELQIFVLLFGDKYDADLMDKLLDIEYEIRKMFPDIVFQFFYPPAGISEKKDFIHPQAECIYMNQSLYLEEEEKNALGEIEEIYEFLNEEKVKDFILQNKDLIEILKEAPTHIYNIFGKVRLALELHSDPEKNWDELFIIIKSPYSVEKTYELGRRLFREWFVNIIETVANRLNFTEEPLSYEF